MREKTDCRKYLSLFRIRFANGLQYRTAAYAGIATQFAWGTMNILLYTAFYRTNPANFPMAFSQLSSYIWLQQAFISLFMVWGLDNGIFELIRSGNIAYELARPVNLYAMWFAKNLGMRLSRAVLRCFPILIIAAFLPAPYNLSAPPEPLAFVMFLLTAMLGFFLVVAFCMLVYIATFYTLSPQGVRLVAIAMTDFFAGAIIPLPFLPDKLRTLFELLPFGSMQNLPLRIYSGNIAGAEMWRLTAVQAFWLLTLTVLGVVWMKHALSRVVVQGG